jgi:hypothetical protein
MFIISSPKNKKAALVRWLLTLIVELLFVLLFVHMNSVEKN